MMQQKAVESLGASMAGEQPAEAGGGSGLHGVNRDTQSRAEIPCRG